MKIKTIKILFFTLLFCLLIPSLALASTAKFTINSNEYYVDGQSKVMDVAPYLKNDRVYLPVRYIAEIFNVETVWSEKQQAVLLYKDNKVVGLFTIGDNVAVVDNNKKIDMDVTPEIVNNRVFLPLRYVAMIFNTDIIWDDRYGTVALGNNNQTQNMQQTNTITTQIIEKNTEKGNLKGTITWQYNNFIGTKPDVGAKVFLIPVGYDKNNLNNQDAKNLAISGVASKNSGIFTTKVNGMGTYEINNIPTGKYIILISSSKTTRNFQEPLSFYVTSTLQPLIKDWDDFVLFNLKLNKHEVDKIEIIPNDIVDFSYDFGNTFI